MKLIKRKESQEMREFNSFVQRLEAEGFELIILDEGRIKSRYGRGLYKKLIASLSQIRAGIGLSKVSFIFDEKNPRISWPSDYYSDRVIINLAHSPGTPEFIEAIKESDRESKLIEEGFEFR